MNPLDEVMTLEEAAERWGKSTDSLRQACISRNGKASRFEIGIEVRQSKRTWLVTRQGMERLYGGELLQNRSNLSKEEFARKLEGLGIGVEANKLNTEWKNRQLVRTFYECILNGDLEVDINKLNQIAKMIYTANGWNVTYFEVINDKLYANGSLETIYKSLNMYLKSSC